MTTNALVGLGEVTEPLKKKRNNRKVFLILLVFVLPESAFALYKIGDAPILGGDGVEYYNLAVNMLEHGTYSRASAPPYEPSVDRSPGYPIFIAFTNLLSGNSFLFLRAVQFMLVFATACLLYALTCDFIDRKSALITSILCATYFPLIFSAIYHLTETLATFLAVTFVFLLIKWRKLQLGWIALALGITAGYLALVRPSFALLLIFALPLCALFDSMLPRLSRAKLCIFALLGYVLCIAPWTIRNGLVAKEFIPLTAARGISLFMSAQQYKGEIKYSIPLSEWALIIDERLSRMRQAERAISEEAPSSVSPNVRQEVLVDRVYTADALEKFKTIPFSRYAISFPERMAYLWSTCDTSPWAAGGAFHRVVQLQFLCISLFALLGLWIRRSQLRALWPLWVVPAYVAVLHTLFHVEPRYSFPARPFLLVYAGIFLAFSLSKIKLGRILENSDRTT